MLSRKYLDTAQTTPQAAQTMTDRFVVQLKAPAEDYERRAEKAASGDEATTLDRSAVRECEQGWGNGSRNFPGGVA